MTARRLAALAVAVLAGAGCPGGVETPVDAAVDDVDAALAPDVVTAEGVLPDAPVLGADVGPDADAALAAELEVSPHDTADPGGAEAGADADPDADADATEVDVYTPACGNGVLDDGEACDDGDLDETDACTTACLPGPDHPKPGLSEVVITELMINPAAAPDPAGEWIELHSLSDQLLALDGCTLRDAGTDLVSIGLAAGPVLLEPGARLLIGSAQDPADNGGIAPDVLMSTMLLDNLADEVVLECEGAFVDSVVYDAETFPVASGAAMALDPATPTGAEANLPGAWCAAFEPYGAGDLGTPGAPNPPCPPPDVEVDHCLVVATDETPAETFVGAKVPLQGLFFEAGLTDATPGNDPGEYVAVQLGRGPAGSLPDAGGWTWTVAQPLDGWTHDGGFDAYAAAVPLDAAGSWDLAARVTLDGGQTWALCDEAPGSLDGYDPAQAVHVDALPNPCHELDCATLPPASCAADGVTALTWGPGPGDCAITDGEAACVFPSSSVDCGHPDLGATCLDGACGAPAAAPSEPGQLVLNELHLAPAATVPELGQWVEITNPTGAPLDLHGCTLTAGTGGATTVDAHVVVGAGAQRVLGRTTSVPVNGGLAIDWAYGASPTLPVSGGTLSLTCDGVLVDAVTWATPGWPVVPGAAMSLGPWNTSASANDAAAAWCPAPTPFGDGDLGSPGAPNPPCPGDVVPVEDCWLDASPTLAVPAGTTVDLAVFVVGPALVVEVGAAPPGADADDPAWSWSAAAPDPAWEADTGVERWIGPLVAPGPGSWQAALRATMDDGHTWRVCGLEPGVAFVPEAAVELTTTPSPCWPSPCGAPPGVGCAADLVVDRVAPAQCQLEGLAGASCAWTELLLDDCGALGASCADGACVDVPQLPEPGSVAVTELLIAPAGDEQGEWLELTNVGPAPVTLAGCELTSGPDEAHTLAAPLATELVLAPGAALVVARGATPSVAHLAPGAALVAWHQDLALDNVADEVALACDQTPIAAVAWDAAAGWVVPPGQALALGPHSLDVVDAPAAWCPAGTGTPGAANPLCPPPDPTIEACWLLTPTSASVAAGDGVGVLAQVLDPGVTDLTPGPDVPEGLLGQIGYGPAGDPPGPTWTWQAALPDPIAESPTIDTWSGTLALPAPGAWWVTARFSADAGATWTSCDLDGAPPLDPGALGQVDASPGSCTPNPCVEAPASTCEGDTADLVGEPGACTPGPGGTWSCAFPTATIACATLGGCDAGACGAPVPTPAAHGDLVVTELLRDSPLPPPDTGEWVELHNPGPTPLDLRGCQLAADAVIPTGPVPLVVPAGGYAVLAGQGADLSDPAWTWPSSFGLANVFGDVTLTCGDTVIDAVAWDLAWPGAPGVPMQLTVDATDAAANDEPLAWCDAPTPAGTPGAPNGACGAVGP